MKLIQFVTGLIVGLVGLWTGIAQGRDAQDVKGQFAKHVGDSKISNASEIVRWIENNADPADAVTGGLIRMYPDYAQAVAASDDDQLNAARQALEPLTQSDDKFLAADASFHLARTLMNNEHYEQALPLLTELSSKLGEFTTQADTIEYYIGQAHAGMLNNQLAIESLVNFLQNFPDAPERLRVSAWRQVQQLQNVAEGQMADIYQRMEFSRRRLEIEEPGQETQVEQDKIIKMLAKLIKEQEKKECSSSNSKKNDPSQNKSQQQQQQAQNQPKESKSQAGGMSNNPNGKFVDKSFDTGNASPWSRIRDMSRDPANAGINDKLPANYKAIVERYNDAVNGNSPEKNKDKSDR